MRNQEIRSQSEAERVTYDTSRTIPYVRLDFPRDSDDLDDEEDDIITAAAPHTYGTNGRTSPLANLAFSHFG